MSGADNSQVDDIARRGLCEVCRKNKADSHIQFQMYGNVHAMPVGGKTFRTVRMVVSLCASCHEKARRRGRYRRNVCWIVFLISFCGFGAVTYTFHNEWIAGVLGGMLLGGISAGVVHSLMSDKWSEESICESVPKVKSLLGVGWHFGNKPSK